MMFAISELSLPAAEIQIESNVVWSMDRRVQDCASVLVMRGEKTLEG
jgi:hypothetical protein